MTLGESEFQRIGDGAERMLGPCSPGLTQAIAPVAERR